MAQEDQQEVELTRQQSESPDNSSRNADIYFESSNKENDKEDLSPSYIPVTRRSEQKHIQTKNYQVQGEGKRKSVTETRPGSKGLQQDRTSQTNPEQERLNQKLDFNKQPKNQEKHDQDKDNNGQNVLITYEQLVLTSPDEGKQSQVLNSKETIEQAVKDISNRCVVLLQKMLLPQCPLEIYREFADIVSPHVQLRLIPKPITEVGQRLLKQGVFLVTLIEHCCRFESDNVSARLNLQTELSSLYLMESGLEVFQQYAREKQKQFQESVKKAAEWEADNIKQDQTYHKAGNKEPDAIKSKNGFKSKVSKPDQRKLSKKPPQTEQLKRQNYEGSKNSKVDSRKQAFSQYGTGYEYALITKSKGVKQVHLTRKSKRLQSKISKSRSLHRSQEPIKVNSQILGTPVQPSSKHHTTSKKAPKSKSTEQHLDLEYLKEHASELIVIENKMIVLDDPLTQEDEKIHEFLQSQQSQQIKEQYVQVPRVRSPSQKRETWPENDDAIQYTDKKVQLVLQQKVVDQPREKSPVVQKLWPPSPKVQIPKDIIASEHFRLKNAPCIAQKVICSSINGNSNYALIKLNKAARFDMGLNYALFPMTNINRRSGIQLRGDLDKIKSILHNDKYVYMTNISNVWPKIKEHQQMLVGMGLSPDTITPDQELKGLIEGKPQKEDVAQRSPQFFRFRDFTRVKSI